MFVGCMYVYIFLLSTEDLFVKEKKNIKKNIYLTEGSKKANTKVKSLAKDWEEGPHSLFYTLVNINGGCNEKEPV